MRYFLFLTTILTLNVIGPSAEARTEERLIASCDWYQSPEEHLQYQVLKTEQHVVLRKRVNGTEIARATIPNPSGVVWWYGDTFILFDNQGKSGYLLLHFNRKMRSSLIDINLFQESLRGLNTRGAQQKFLCTKSSE